MIGRLTWLLLGVACLAPAPLLAEEDPVLIEEVRLGLAGGVSDGSGAAPAWLILSNPSGRELSVEAVISQGESQARRRWLLPPGGRQRAFLAWRPWPAEVVRVAIWEEGAATPLAERALDPPQLVPAKRHLVVLEGPAAAEERRGPAGQWSSPVLGVSHVPAGDAPLEAECYRGYAGVALRGVDPDALEPDQRGALQEYVTQGGVLLALPGGNAPGLPAHLVEAFALGPGRTVKVLGMWIEVRPCGLGAVVALPEDPLLGPGRDERAAALLRQELGDLLQTLAESSPNRAGSPLLYDQRDADLFGGPGTASRALVAVFFLAYLVAAGPFLAFAMRKAPRQRLALAVAAVIGGFTLLTPLAAGLVRSASGTAYQLTVLLADGAGPLVELSDVTVVSGGATHYTVRLHGPPLAATEYLGAAPRQYGWQGNDFGWSRPSYRSLRTERGEQLERELQTGSWGRRSVTISARVPETDRPRLEARVSGGTLILEHLGGPPLEQALLVSPELIPGAPYRRLGPVVSGARLELPLELPRLLEPPPQPGDRLPPSWEEVLELPETVSCWREVKRLATPGELVPPPYVVLLARYRPLVAVSGPSLRVEPLGLLVCPLRLSGGLGITIRLDEEGRAVVSRLLPGSPAERAGLRVGDRLVRIDGEDVRQDPARASQLVTSLREPGEPLIVEVERFDEASESWSPAFFPLTLEDGR